MATIGYGSMDWGKTTDGYYTPGGSCWARCYAPADYLARNGIETTIGRPVFHQDSGSLCVAPFNSDTAEATEVVVLQRTMHDWAPDAIRKARASGQIVISDIDDWFWGLDPRNSAWRSTDPNVNPASNRDHYRRALAASTAVTVSTPYLAERIRRMMPEQLVVVVPNAIDLARYDPKTTDDAGDCPTIGWVGALAWRSGDLGVAANAVKAFCHQRGAAFHHAGKLDPGPQREVVLAGDLHGWFGAAGEIIGVRKHTHQPMSTIFDYPRVMFGRLDVGIVPLTDQPFNRAKSNIKGLEYAAAGVPFVASAMPEYVELERAGVGRTAGRHRDWQRELARMADPGYRQAERVRNAAGVAQFDLAVRWRAWADAYDEIRRSGR